MGNSSYPHSGITLPPPVSKSKIKKKWRVRFFSLNGASGCFTKNGASDSFPTMARPDAVSGKLDFYLVASAWFPFPPA